MELTREDIIMCTIINQLNKAIEKGVLKLPGDGPHKTEIVQLKKKNLNIKVPSQCSSEDLDDDEDENDSSEISKIASPEYREGQRFLNIRKMVKKVS